MPITQFIDGSGKARLKKTCARILMCYRSSFTTAEKKNYIAAVKCMSKLPSKTPQEQCPGCKNRFDDFLGTHINQTFAVRTFRHLIRSALLICSSGP